MKIINTNNDILQYKTFGLIYGTLLGAIRENNFIEDEEDINIFILNENKEVFLIRYLGNLLFLIQKMRKK